MSTRIIVQGPPRASLDLSLIPIEHLDASLAVWSGRTIPPCSLPECKSPLPLPSASQSPGKSTRPIDRLTLPVYTASRKTNQLFYILVGLLGFFILISAFSWWRGRQRRQASIAEVSPHGCPPRTRDDGTGQDGLFVGSVY